MGLDELPCNVFVPAAVPDRIPQLAFDDAVVNSNYTFETIGPPIPIIAITTTAQMTRSIEE